MNDSKTFECWAIVEVMGHRQLSGFVSEQALGGASFIRVDVPCVVVDGEQLPAFTKLLGAGSIYAISPCTEETARAFAAQSRQRSFATYEAPRLAAPAVKHDCDDPLGVNEDVEGDDDYGDESYG